jgi:hypothetical protein
VLTNKLSLPAAAQQWTAVIRDAAGFTAALALGAKKSLLLPMDANQIFYYYQ